MLLLNGQPAARRPLPPLSALSAGDEVIALRSLGQWISDRLGAATVCEPFRQNLHVFRAISVIVLVLQSLPRRLLRGEDQEVTSGPAWELLHRPEPGVNISDFFEDLFVALLESGEAHVFDPDPAHRRPERLVVASRREMQIVRHADTGELLFWRWRFPGARKPEVILPEQDAYMRMANPYDKYRGLAPSEAFALGMQADYLSQQHSVSSLENGGQPGGIFKFARKLSDEERSEFRRALEARHRGDG